MSKLLLTSALCGALSGGAIVGLTFLTRPSSPTSISAEEAAQLEQVAAAPSEGWREELDKLRVENQMLAQRLASLESGAGAGARTAVVSPEADLSVEEIGALKQLVAKSGPVSVEGASAPVLYSNVKGALEDIRAQEEAEREERRRQAEAERLERDLEKMATDLAMDGFQTDAMRRILTERNEQRSQMMDLMREGGADWETVRDQGRAQIERLDGQVKTTLSSEQYAAFQEKYGLTGFGGRGPSGFGGGRNRGD
jgi:uncharacterized protein (UPF0335 family)